MRTTIALLAVLLVAAPARAQVYDGNQLKDGLDNYQKVMRNAVGCGKELVEGFIAAGYVTGVAAAWDDQNLFCRPENSTRGQVIDVVSKFLDNHPEHRHQAATTLIGAALGQAFPCPKK